MVLSSCYDKMLDQNTKLLHSMFIKPISNEIHNEDVVIRYDSFKCISNFRGNGGKRREKYSNALHFMTQLDKFT